MKFLSDFFLNRGGLIYTKDDNKVLTEERQNARNFPSKDSLHISHNKILDKLMLI